MNGKDHARASGCGWWVVVPVVWVFLILVGSFMPGGPPAPGGLRFEHMDLALHFFGYAGLAGVMYRSSTRLHARARLSAVLIFPLCLGGVVELLQPLVGRTRSWQDAAANAAGTVVGCVVGALLWRRR